MPALGIEFNRAATPLIRRAHFDKNLQRRGGAGGLVEMPVQRRGIVVIAPRGDFDVAFVRARVVGRI